MTKVFPTIVLMGPSGCGKTVIAGLLSKTLNIPFVEGDAFHSQKNKEKMSLCISLTDDDRWPWLKKISQEINRFKKNSGSCVSCSALKKSYRDILRNGDMELIFVYLKGKKEIIFERIGQRKNHYMKPGVLDDQFAILEEPMEDENAIVVSTNDSPKKICQNIIEILNLHC